MSRTHRLLVLPLLWTVACTADLSGVGVGPADPLTTDTLRLAVGEAGDLSVSWFVDGVEVEDLRDALEVSADRTSRGQAWAAHVWAQAGADRTETPDRVIEVVIGNTAPEILGAMVSPDVPDTTDDLVADFEGEDVDGDGLLWRVQWLKDGEVVEGLGADRVSAGLTTRGETWTVRAWLSDGDLEVGPAEASVMIDNVAPVARRVEIAPEVAFEDSELVASPSGFDDDGDPVTWSYAWSVDGVEVEGKTTDRLDGADFAKGQTVTVRATPSDGFVTGEPAVSEGVIIRNTAPTADGARIEPAAPTETDTVTCIGEGFADIDGDDEAWLVAWTVDGVPAGTGPTLDGGAFDRDQVIGCTLRPFDGEEAGAPVTAPPVTVLNTAPALASAAIDPSAPVTTDALSAALGAATDVDDDAVSYTYAWTVDGSAAGTDATLPAEAFVRGQIVGLTVTPTDGTDAGTPVVATAITVLNSAPVVSAVSLSPSDPATDDAITASVTASDADDDELTFTCTWSVDGVEVAGETAATLPSSAFVKGDDVTVTVVPSDGTDDGTAFTSAAVTVVNSPPTLAKATLSPSTVRENDTVTCAPSGFEDIDGDEASYAYAWTVDGADVAVTTATLDGSHFDRGASVVCTITPSDGTDDGEAVASDALIIANTAPEVASVSLSSLTPQTADDVVATAVGVTDADGDDVDLTWVWTVDGATVRTVTGSALSDTLPASETSKGEAIAVTVTPADDAESGSAVSSATATVANTAPVITAVSLSPSDVYTNTDVAASVSATDADGDSLTATWVWKVNGVTLSETSSTLASTHFGKGDTVTVEATISDGTGSAGPVSGSATVLNTAPTGGAVSLSGETPTDDLVCSVDSLATDLDGDTLTYSVAWELDGTAWTGSVSTGTRTGDTIPSSETEWGDEWQCFVTVDDGDTSIELSSSVQGIVPVAPEIAYGSGGGTTAWRGGSDSATSSIADGCPTDEYLVGIRAEVYSSGVWVGAANRCAPLEVTCDLDGCTVSTGTITTGSMRKATNGARTETRDCPDGQVVTGWAGRSGSITDEVTLRCRPITVSYDGTSWSADIGTSFNDLSPMGYAAGGAPYSRVDCLSTSLIRTGAVQINHYWNSGGYVGMSMFCREPEAVE